METYNGWSNRDTWLVNLWLGNDYNNYMRVQHKIKGIGTNKKLKDFTCCELENWLRRLHYGDKINWSLVNINEIRESLLEEY